MVQIALAVFLLLLLATVGFAFATYAAANKFFARLLQKHPELSDAFSTPSPLTRYGPIRPSYMNYLKAKKYLALPDSGLRSDGASVLKLLYLHAATFVGMIVAGLWWSYLHGA